MKIIQTQNNSPSQIFETMKRGAAKTVFNEIFFEASNVRLKLKNQKLLCYIDDKLHCAYI